MAEPRADHDASPHRDQDDPALLELTALLARAAKVHDRPEGLHLFELAVSAEPSCAVAWLWLAALTDREATADARIRTALDLDLGQAVWREACGVLLMAIALRRRRLRPESARAILIEAQYVLPRDARIWVALALTASRPASRLAYLERAVELEGIGADRVRAEMLLTAVDAALECGRAGRAAAVSDALLRARAASPADQRVRATAKRFDRLGSEDRPTAPVTPALDRGRDETWWVRAPRRSPEGSAAWVEAMDGLAALRRSLESEATLLQQFASDAMVGLLLQSAADLTASADAAHRRRGSADRGPMPPRS